MKPRLFLVVPVVCVLFAGCAQDQYTREREYYSVQKKAAVVLSNPQATPPMELKKILNLLESFMVKYPETGVALDAQITLVRIYAAVKDYSKAHAELVKVGKTYVKSESVCADAIFMRGNLYEDQGDWDKALAQYKTLLQLYPRTLRGFESSFFIAMRYKAKLQPDKMRQALRESLAYYKGIVIQAPDSPWAIQSRVMVAKSYGELNEWEKTIETLESTIKDFKGKVAPDSLMLEIASIYISKLNDVKSARDYLTKIINEFPKARSTEIAKMMLAKLDKDKK